MKALSFSRPWDYLILHPPFKTVENRTWRTGYRGRIYVHRAKSVDIGGWSWIRANAAHLGISRHDLELMIELCHVAPLPLQSSGIVGEIDIVDCVDSRLLANGSPWFFGPYGFLLANPVAYDNAIPYRGMPGLFDVELPETKGERP